MYETWGDGREIRLLLLLLPHADASSFFSFFFSCSPILCENSCRDIKENFTKEREREREREWSPLLFFTWDDDNGRSRSSRRTWEERITNDETDASFPSPSRQHMMFCENREERETATREAKRWIFFIKITSPAYDATASFPLATGGGGGGGEWVARHADHSCISRAKGAFRCRSCNCLLSNCDLSSLYIIEASLASSIDALVGHTVVDFVTACIHSSQSLSHLSDEICKWYSLLITEWNILIFSKETALFVLPHFPASCRSMIGDYY